MLTTPRALLDSFLGAFSRLDLDAMLACFAPQATAFFPVAHQQTRLDDKAAIAAAFAAVLAQLRATRMTSLPIAAENLVVQEWDDTAVATFHLRGVYLSRRTLVLQRGAGEWRIVHLHASNASFAD
jgi:ketosteroid isomerase-like protein